jgi:ferredoxin
LTYVIVEACVGTKNHSCVEVCPVDCIHPTPDEEGFATASQLYIDPTECIDCNSCVESCPVDACIADYAIPEEQRHMIQANADFFNA